MNNQNNSQKALKAAQNILACADNSESQLYGKLIRKGIADTDAEAAVTYCVERGWLDEERQVKAALRYLSETKLYGRRRIALELRRRGYKNETVESCDFGDIDFAGLCRRLWEKLGGDGGPKTLAALAKNGFSPDDIRAARRAMEAEKDKNNENDGLSQEQI